MIEDLKSYEFFIKKKIKLAGVGWNLWIKVNYKGEDLIGIYTGADSYSKIREFYKNSISRNKVYIYESLISEQYDPNVLILKP